MYILDTGVLVAWKSFFIMLIFYVQFRYWCLSCMEIIFHNVNFICTVYWCLSCLEIIFHNVNFICTVYWCLSCLEIIFHNDSF